MIRIPNSFHGVWALPNVCRFMLTVLDRSRCIDASPGSRCFDQDSRMLAERNAIRAYETVVTHRALEQFGRRERFIRAMAIHNGYESDGIDMTLVLGRPS